MRKLLKNNQYFFATYFLFLAVSLILLFSFSKADLHILLNRLNTPFFDEFFKYATFLGDGLMIAILFVLLLSYRYRFAFAFLIGALLTSGVVQLFKKVLLENMFRPSKYFELFETFQLHLVDGVKLHSLQSFPSGHTATAFNIFFFLALISKNNGIKILCAVLAAIVAYSRVYISQHFLVDITVGSVIGIILTFIFFYWSTHWEKAWLNKSIISNFIRAK